MSIERNPVTIDVDIDEWEKAQGDSILETRGLGPCIGIASYDPISRTGHLLHAANPDSSPDLLDEFFDSIKETAHDPSQVVFYVRGGHAFQIDETELSEGSRQVTYERLREFGGMALFADVEWTENPEGVVDMRLDTLTGSFESESTTLLELLEQLGRL